MPVSPPGTTAQPRRRTRMPAARRRELILQAAAQVFAERGYSGASMTDIAAAAGIAPSVIYDHFGCKRDLHIELLTEHAGDLVRATTRPPGRESGAEQVRSATEAFFRFVEQHRYAWRMLFRDPPADEQIAAAHARIHRQGTAAIARLIHRAQGFRLPESMPRTLADEMLARAIKSANDGLASWWYQHPEVPRQQVVDVAVGLYWHGLAGLTSGATDRSG